MRLMNDTFNDTFVYNIKMMKRTTSTFLRKYKLSIFLDIDILDIFVIKIVGEELYGHWYFVRDCIIIEYDSRYLVSLALQRGEIIITDKYNGKA